LGVFDVPAGSLIKEIAADLKKQGLKSPDWSLFVKTGPSRERAPDSPDWFFERAASILYRIYKQGPLGTESLRSYYGGKKRRGVRKPKFKKAGGKIIRVCLQELEKDGLIKKDKKGRIITGKGQSYLNRKAKDAAALAKGPGEKEKAQEPKHGEKSVEEKKVEAELKKQEAEARAREKAKEEEKKKEKKKEEKKAEKREEES